MTAVLFLFSGGDGGGGEHEAAKVENEDEKIAKLVEESNNGCHKLSFTTKINLFGFLVVVVGSYE